MKGMLKARNQQTNEKLFWRGHGKKIRSGYYRILLQFLRIFCRGPGRFHEAAISDKYSSDSRSVHWKGGYDSFASRF
jgi:hypothetical protein